MSLQPIDPIPAVAPRPSLTTTARPLPDDVNWRTGIEFRDNGARTRGIWPYQAGTEHADKSSFEPTAPALAAFRPVMLYVPLDCDYVTVGQLGTEDSWLAEARDELDATSAYQLARTLAGGVAADEWANDPDCDAGINPTLSQPYPGQVFTANYPDGSTANAVVGTAGDHPIAGLGDLLDAYTDTTRKGGATVHVDMRILPHLLAMGIVKLQGDIYVGPGGSVVIPHAELVGPATDAAGVPDAPAAGNRWMYITGPVEYALGEARVLPEERAQRFYGYGRTNRWSVIAERQGIVRFNPSVVFAAEVVAPDEGV